MLNSWSDRDFLNRRPAAWAGTAIRPALDESFNGVGVSSTAGPILDLGVELSECEGN